MADKPILSIKKMANHKVPWRSPMKTYAFKVVVEPDDDRWFAYCPVLEERGAATWGYTEEEAFKNIQEVVQMVVEELIEDGEPIPEGPENEVQILSEPRVVVTV